MNVRTKICICPFCQGLILTGFLVRNLDPFKGWVEQVFDYNDLITMSKKGQIDLYSYNSIHIIDL